jgi:hypothetical protein
MGLLPDIRDEDELGEIYVWVDSIPLSKQKKNITRDFSDAVCVADIIHYYQPKLVDLHNYSPTSNSKQKMENWRTLNDKVLKKIGMKLSVETMRSVVSCEVGCVERVLKLLRNTLYRLSTGHGSGTDENTCPTQMDEKKGMVSYIPAVEERGQSEDHDGRVIDELHDVIRVLELKCAKQEEVIRLKDAKIEALTRLVDDYSKDQIIP